MPRVIAVTSGKGGVGKSNFVLNVGIALAMMDCTVQILDADLGLANLDILLGVRPMRNLDDVVSGSTALEDIIVKTDYGVDLIPGSSGEQSMADLDEANLDSLIKAVGDISRDKDFLLVDTGAGISKSVVSFLMAVPEVLVAVSSEPTSLTDAYALIKVLIKNGFEGRISIFASEVKDGSEGRAIFKKVSSAAQRFLHVQLDYAGCVCRDEKLKLAVGEQVPVIDRFPSAEISRCYRVIATTMLGQEAEEISNDKLWSRMVRMMFNASKPRKLVPVNGGQSNPAPAVQGDDKMLQAILDEQRRTRLLLERILYNIEHDNKPTLVKGSRH